MNALDTRLRRLEASRLKSEPCPEHLALAGAAPVDYRDGLEAFSPDPAVRAGYRARMDRLEAQPPCTRCGWRPTVIRVVCAEDWGQHGDPGA